MGYDHDYLKTENGSDIVGMQPSLNFNLLRQTFVWKMIFVPSRIRSYSHVEMWLAVDSVTDNNWQSPQFFIKSGLF